LLAATALSLTPSLTAPLWAKESLGVYSGWAAFRDAEVPRCYAIAQSFGSQEAYASIGTWPRQGVRGQVYIRLSRALAANPRVRLFIGGERFDLVAEGQQAWARDKREDAKVIAAMRAATRMSISATTANGRRFTDRYALEGAATAMDASLLGCAQDRTAQG
jgi:hypothetical protein